MHCFTSAILESARSSIACRRGWLPALLLGVVYVTVLCAGFVAPYDYSTQYRAFALCPPRKIHFRDARGHTHLRPFVYALKPGASPGGGYEEDQSTPYPVQFFVAGSQYMILGLLSGDVHLFGVQDGGHIFLLGTDALGRDVLSRLLFGGQISLIAGTAAAAMAVIAGLFMGGISGFYGGWTDEVIMRVAEVFLSVPWLYLLLTVRALLPLRLSPFAVFLLLMTVSGLIGWGRPARLVRGVVLSAREREYVLAARSFGASDLYIIRRHVLPEAYSIALTQAAIYIPQYITAEVTLSFFGLGVSEPEPSWGNMLAQVRSLFLLQSCWWLFAPAVSLVLVLAIFAWLFQTKLKRP